MQVDKARLELRARRNRGQGMTEYIIVVALIAIAAIGVTSVFGQDVRGIYGAATQALGGSSNVTVHTVNGNVSTSQGYAPATLGTFAKN